MTSQSKVLLISPQGLGLLPKDFPLQHPEFNYLLFRSIAELNEIVCSDFSMVIVDANEPEILPFIKSLRDGGDLTPILAVTSTADSHGIELLYDFPNVDHVDVSVSAKILNAKMRRASTQFKGESERHQAGARLEASEERYRTLFNSIDEGFALIELIFDENNSPIDYLFLETNPVFEKQTGLKDVLGKTAKQLVPNLETRWFEVYGNVALTGEPIRFTESAPSMGRWFSVYATRVGGESSRTVVLLFSDISERKLAEEENERLFAELKNAHQQMIDIFKQAPAFMCTLHGPEHRIYMVNDCYLQLIGWREVRGLTVAEALPEVVSQGYVDLLDAVYQAGEPFVGSDVEIALERTKGQAPEVKVVDFVYVPLKNVDGEVFGIFVHGVDITERKQAEQKLQAFADDLAQANRRKTEFLATLAHELRNPLAPVVSGLELLLRAQGNTSSSSKTLEMMRRQVHQMVHLVDDLLDIARITSGKIDLKTESVELRTVIETALETSFPTINMHRHNLTMQVPERSINVFVDPTRISQVLTNILTNAAKYTPYGGSINLEVQLGESQVVISVTDSGEGIPADALDDVFDMFTQVGSNKKRAQGGLGIGLSLVKEIIKLHGGEVCVASEGVGMGSTFTVTLPLAVDSVSTDRSSNGLEKSEALDHESLRVLIADDNVDAGETMANLLEILGYHTHVVNDGLAALKALEAYQPHVAFIDIGMPEMDGYQVAKTARESSSFDKIILVALTGWGSEDDRLKTKTAGFDHHLTKPASVDAVQTLLATIGSSLSSSRVNQLTTEET